MRIPSRAILLAWCATTLASAADLRWVDASTLRIEGRGWKETKAPFDRLPAKASGVVRGQVYSLGRDAAGIAIHFTSDTPTLAVRWKLRRERLAMSHMAATGVSGVDLYARIGDAWRWVGVGRPEKFPLNEVTLFKGQAAQSREFLLYLPLYNGIEQLELGVAGTATVTAAAVDPRRPIVIYGTSAVQGGCASRPGMAYPAILGRRLGWPTLNLGFSGNGKAEPEMAALLAELDAAIYVIDCVPNLEPGEVTRVEPFVRTLRDRHPATPILLIENLAYPDGVLVQERRDRYVAANRTLREIYERLRTTDSQLHYLEATRLLDPENEGTVDGNHPTDLGFTRMADALTPILRGMLARQ